MKKILVPIDFSDVSRLAAEFAIDLAERSGAEVVFLHSMHFNYFNDFPYAPGLNLQQMIADVQDAVENNMRNFVAEFKTNANIDTEVSGLHLPQAVKDIVDERNIGLVIIGTKGSSGWSEFLVGSNTERVVRWANCPVISVPTKSSFDSIKRILVPIDLSEIQEDFMIKLSKLQKLFSAHMEFLWVRTPHNIENSEMVTGEFNEVLKKYGFRDSSFTIAKSVFPADGILQQVADLNADMVAMATHSRRGISHWLSGSLTEDTVNHVHVPVWTFKLDKDAKSIKLSSFRDAYGKAEYQKIELLAE